MKRADSALEALERRSMLSAAVAMSAAGHLRDVITSAAASATGHHHHLGHHHSSRTAGAGGSVQYSMLELAPQSLLARNGAAAAANSPAVTNVTTPPSG